MHIISIPLARTSYCDMQLVKAGEEKSKNIYGRVNSTNSDNDTNASG